MLISVLGIVQGGSASLSSSAHPSVPRGPPRKPKQSGHALWVGNLPPATTVIELKDYFAREATRNIESVFLISKSNCAFVNYKSELACSAAMTRFHDSRFRGVRLVCRLRRISNNPASGVPVGPASSALPTLSVQPPDLSQHRSAEGVLAEEPPTHMERSDREQPRAEKKDKFFIVKSLTVEDLESSVRNGIWATQAHNEVALNEAFAVRTFHLLLSEVANTVHPSRPVMCTLSFRLISLASILATLEWLPQSTRIQPLQSSGRPRFRAPRSLITQERYQHPPQKPPLKAGS